MKKDEYIKELEKLLFSEKEVSTRRQNEIKVLTERLNDEARRIKSLDREGDRLRSEISLLESKVCLNILLVQTCALLLLFIHPTLVNIIIIQYSIR